MNLIEHHRHHRRPMVQGHVGKKELLQVNERENVYIQEFTTTTCCWCCCC